MDNNIRRVVTGHTASGESVFISDGAPPRIVTFDNIPGLMLAELWATDSVPTIPASGDPTEQMSLFVPAPGGTRFRFVRIPSAQELAQAQAAGVDLAGGRDEYRDKAPDLARAHETEDPGMHTTETTDYIIVLSGEVWLELDNGAKAHLKPGDFVVQNGTRHAWRNHGSEACVLVSVMVGARRG